MSSQRSADSRKNNLETRLLVKLGLGTALVYLAWLAPGIYSVDGNSMLAVAESICISHSLAVPVGLGNPGRAGLTYSSWYPLLSFLAVPFVDGGVLLAHFMRVPVHYVAAMFGLVLQALIAGAAIAFVGGLAIRLGCDRSSARLAALSFGFGTIALGYARTFFSEPLLALVTVASLFFAMGSTKSSVKLSAVLSGLAVLVKPTGIVIGPIVALYLALKRRTPRAAIPTLIGSSAGLLLYCAYNYYRFGNVLAFGQPFTFSLSAIPVGMAGMIASPGWGLLWFCPPVLLVVPGVRSALRRCPVESVTLVAVFLAYLLIYSLWASWHGGWSWGPRFLLPALAGVMPFTAFLKGRWRKALVGVSIAGFLINAPTLFSFYERYLAELNDQGVALSAWEPWTSPALHAWPAAFRETQDAVHTPVVTLVEGAGTGPSKHVATSRSLRVVALWWWLLPAVHVPRWIGVAISAVLMLMGIRLIAGPQAQSADRGVARYTAGCVET